METVEPSKFISEPKDGLNPIFKKDSTINVIFSRIEEIE